MADAVDVRPVDELATAIWLREVEVAPSDWGTAELARAARLLGRVAASPRVRPLASIGEADGRRGVRSYAEGRLALQVDPMLRADDLWHHPVLAETFDPALRTRLLAHLERVAEYVDWLEHVPDGTAHGDACPNNLLVQTDSDDLVLIDFGFWSTQPLGFDLSQLLLGDVQIGRRPAEHLGPLEAACVAAYVDGLRDEGCDTPAAVVQRAHALQMLIFSGLSAFFLDELGSAAAPTPDLLAKAAERARISEFVLDLVEQTEGTPHPA